METTIFRIEDNVAVYAHTTILARETIVGEIFAMEENTFVIESVYENTKVSAYAPELNMRKQGN